MERELVKRYVLFEVRSQEVLQSSYPSFNCKGVVTVLDNTSDAVFEQLILDNKVSNYLGILFKQTGQF